MDISPSSMAGLFQGFNTTFNKGFNNVKAYWSDVAMKVPSSTSSNTYAWLGDMPGIRKWLGDRVVNELSGSKYRIENELFEETIAVKRTMVEDDEYGVFGPMMEKLGHDTATHPDILIFNLLAQGFTTLCYDGQFFFDTDHPVSSGTPNEHSVSNRQDGSGPAWYLLDCSQPIRPLIYQERLPFKLTQLTDDKDDIVFLKDKFVYGVRGRSNAGFGLWQMAYASKDALNVANFTAARTAMQKFHNDAGKPLGVKPTHLLVPPDLEMQARSILTAETINGGDTNVWAKTAEMIVSPYLERQLALTVI